MLGAILPGLISAGASLFAGNKQAKDTKKQQQQEYERQKEFAQSGIQWKAEDAKKAGIHPIYAMGASTSTYSPQAVGDTGTGAMAQAGQDIGRAIDATRTAPQRMDAFTRTAESLTLTKMGLENELLASQVAKVKQQIGPPMPGGRYLIDGQGQSQLDTFAPPLMHDAKLPQFTTNLRAFGKDISPSPNWSDAQTFEDRYGEMSDFIAGPAIAYSDYWRNAWPALKAEVYDKLRK